MLNPALLLTRLSSVNDDRETVRTIVFALADIEDTSMSEYLFALPVEAVARAIVYPSHKTSLKDGIGMINIGDQTITIVDLRQKFTEIDPKTDTTLDYLLMQYPDDVSCCWAYSRALSVFQQQNAMDRPNTLLKEAVATNRFVPAYLLGDKPFPDDLPDLVGVGDPSEAVEYCDYALNAWTQTPGAIPWLQQHSP